MPDPLGIGGGAASLAWGGLFGPGEVPETAPFTLDEERYRGLGKYAMGNQYDSFLAEKQAQKDALESLWATQADRMSALGSAGKLGEVGDEYQRYLTGQSGMSRAEVLARAMGDQTQRNAYSMANAQRGGPTAAGLRAAMMSGAQQGLETNAQIAQLRAQEQEAARQGMVSAYGRQGDLYGGLRGQGINQYNAGNQAALGYGGLSQGFSQQALEAQSRMDQIRAQAYGAKTSADSAANQSNAHASSAFGSVGL